MPVEPSGISLWFSLSASQIVTLDVSSFPLSISPLIYTENHIKYNRNGYLAVGMCIISHITTLFVEKRRVVLITNLALRVTIFAGAYCVIGSAWVLYLLCLTIVSWLTPRKFMITMSKQAFIPVAARTFFSPILAHLILSSHNRIRSGLWWLCLRFLFSDSIRFSWW